jgi:hypothetical protein
MTHGEAWREDLRAHKHTLELKDAFNSQESTQWGGFKTQDKPSQYIELKKDVTARTDAISRFSDTDWWAWKRGSALFFWSWPIGEQRRSAQDGMLIWV